MQSSRNIGQKLSVIDSDLVMFLIYLFFLQSCPKTAVFVFMRAHCGDWRNAFENVRYFPVIKLWMINNDGFFIHDKNEFGLTNVRYTMYLADSKIFVERWSISVLFFFFLKKSNFCLVSKKLVVHIKASGSFLLELRCDSDECTSFYFCILQYRFKCCICCA